MISKTLATLEPAVVVHDDCDVHPALNEGHRDQSRKIGERRCRPLDWGIRNHGKHHDISAGQGSDNLALHSLRATHRVTVTLRTEEERDWSHLYKPCTFTIQAKLIGFADSLPLERSLSCVSHRRGGAVLGVY